MNPDDIEVAKINIDKLKSKKYKSQQDNKQCKITYGIDRKPLIIRTPLTIVPTGLIDGSFGKNKKYSFEINISGSPELDTFRNKLNEIDNKNIEFIQSQSKEWWGKSMTRKYIEENCIYTSIVKHKEDHPDKFKIRLPFLKEPHNLKFMTKTKILLIGLNT